MVRSMYTVPTAMNPKDFNTHNVGTLSASASHTPLGEIIYA